MRTGWAGFLLLLWFLLVLPGCPHDPHASHYTTGKPRVSDLLGTYRPTEDSIHLVTGRGGYEKRPSSISLGDGGTLRFEDVPDWWNTPFGKPGGRFDSASGSWEIVRKQDRWWALRVQFPREALLASLGEKPVSSSGQILLVGEQPPYTLHLSIGDPDEGLAMQYVKVSPAQGR